MFKKIKILEKLSGVPKQSIFLRQRCRRNKNNILKKFSVSVL